MSICSLFWGSQLTAAKPKGAQVAQKTESDFGDKSLQAINGIMSHNKQQKVSRPQKMFIDGLLCA